MNRIITTCLLACLVCGCTSQHSDRVYLDPPPLKLPDLEFINSAEGQDIAEVVFRYQMAHPGEYKDPDTWYLSVCQKDPRPEFLARFKTSPVSVKAASTFKNGGIGLHVDDIRRVDKTMVLVPCGFYQANVSAAFHDYTLKKQDPAAWDESRQSQLETRVRWIDEEKKKLGEVFFMPGVDGPGLMGIYGEVGLEAFSYFLADCPEIIVELLERNTIMAVTVAEHYPANHGLVAGFLGDDIAFHSGPLLSPAWLREHYFPRLARTIDAWHDKGIKVLFHSDGNLNPILDDLVDAGIDGLNPIEVLAGMNIAAIHRRHPGIFMAGGIDVSQLLPFGSPARVKDAVTRAIDAAEGRIMIGSSTELNNDVPLENFLALREAVFENPY